MMAPLMFTLVSTKSHQQVQESHQSLLVVAGFLRWDFPLSAQGNRVDIFPATPMRCGGSLSINSSLITITLFHTDTKTDFGREGGINLCSWSFLEIWLPYTTPIPMQPVVP